MHIEKELEMFWVDFWRTWSIWVKKWHIPKKIDCIGV